MKDAGTVTTINLYYFDKNSAKNRETKPVTATTPIVRDVHITNVTCDGAKTAGDIVGLPEMPVSNVVLEKVRITAKKGMIIQDAKGVTLHDVQIVPEQGKPLTITHADVKTDQPATKNEAQQ